MLNIFCKTSIFIYCRYWCSTKVDNELEHIGGQGNWGFCRQSCPPITPRPTTPRPIDIFEYQEAMHDFSQRFLVAAWDENENFVFSPFSLYSVLAVLTMGVTDNSKTQLELLEALGKFQNLQNIEKNYRDLAEQYNNSSIDKILSFGNRLWTTRKFFNKMEQNYLRKIKDLYDADMKIFAKENPEKYINDWVKRKTKGRINKIIGNLCFKLLSKLDFINDLSLTSFNDCDRREMLCLV